MIVLCWFSAFLARSIGDFTLSYFAGRTHIMAYSLKWILWSVREPPCFHYFLFTQVLAGDKWGTKRDVLSYPRGGILLFFLLSFPRPCQASNTAVYNEQWKIKLSIKFTAIKEENIYGWLIDFTWLSHKSWH